MLRCDYKLNTACNRVSIEANTCIQFEKSDNESIPIGTPVLWDEALMLKIDIDKYRIYHICCIFVPNGMYSRITDYKKIWKLAGIPPGFYDGHIPRATVKCISALHLAKEGIALRRTLQTL